MKKHLIQLFFRKNNSIATIITSYTTEENRDHIIANMALECEVRVRHDNPNLDLGTMFDYRYLGVEGDIRFI